MEEELTCAVCNEIYKEPMLLRCGHSYCKVCLDNIVRNASLSGEGMGWLSLTPVYRFFVSFSETVIDTNIYARFNEKNELEYFLFVFEALSTYAYSSGLKVC